MVFEYKESLNGYLVTMSDDSQKIDSTSKENDVGVNDIFEFIQEHEATKVTILS